MVVSNRSLFTIYMFTSSIFTRFTIPTNLDLLFRGMVNIVPFFPNLSTGCIVIPVSLILLKLNMMNVFISYLNHQQLNLVNMLIWMDTMFDGLYFNTPNLIIFMLIPIMVIIIIAFTIFFIIQIPYTIIEHHSTPRNFQVF